MASRTIPTSSDVERRAVNAEDARLAFEREKWEAERKLREQEMAFREADRPSPWRSPLTIAVVPQPWPVLATLWSRNSTAAHS